MSLPTSFLHLSRVRSTELRCFHVLLELHPFRALANLSAYWAGIPNDTMSNSLYGPLPLYFPESNGVSTYTLPKFLVSVEDGPLKAGQTGHLFLFGLQGLSASSSSLWSGLLLWFLLPSCLRSLQDSSSSSSLLGKTGVSGVTCNKNWELSCQTKPIQCTPRLVGFGAYTE